LAEARCLSEVEVAADQEVRARAVTIVQY